MTGFGRAEKVSGERVITVEIKSLNGKQLELNIKMPSALKVFEFEIRTLLQQHLQRGSLDMSISVRQNGTAKPVLVNNELARQYYQSIRSLASELELPETDLLGALLKFPDVITPAAEQLSDAEWQEIQAVITEAMKDLETHRQDEGAMLEKELQQRIQMILGYQEKIALKEPQRREKMRQKLESLLNEHVGKERTDPNRLEQELVYYIEKMDITEELARLINHCRYFTDILKEQDPVKGKKLGFVLQEIGREINTTGSKASDADIQQWVVMMKDELEKAKEQALNVL
jgi:uncharacterized protein (TIGR00255 family)